MSNNTRKKIFLAGTAALAVFLPFVALKPSFVLLLMLIYYICLVFVLNPLWGFLLLIILRPSLDIFSADSILSLSGFSLNFSAVLGGMSILLSLFIILSQFKKTRTIPLKFPILAFLLITLSSVFFSISPSESFIEWIKLLSIFAVYFGAFILIDSENGFKKLIAASIISAIIPAGLAFAQYLAGTGLTVPLEGIYNRIHGTFVHPNMFAYYLILPISLLILLILNKGKDQIRAIGLAMALVFLTLLLILTFTRGAWLAFIIVVFLTSVVKFRKFLIIFIMGLALSYFLVEPINSRVNDLLFNPNNSIEWRVNLWKDSLGYIAKAPIIGSGTGTARDVILKNRGFQFGSTDPHNDYLKIALENGLLGLVSYCLLAISLLMLLFKKMRKEKDESNKLTILILLSVILSLFVMSFADNILRNTAMQWTLWALLGGLFSVLKFPNTNQTN